MQCCCWLQHPALPHCRLLCWLLFALCTGLATSAISSTAGVGLAWQWHPPASARLVLQVCAAELQLPLYAQQTQCCIAMGFMVIYGVLARRCSARKGRQFLQYSLFQEGSTASCQRRIVVCTQNGTVQTSRVLNEPVDEKYRYVILVLPVTWRSRPCLRLLTISTDIFNHFSPTDRSCNRLLRHKWLTGRHTALMHCHAEQHSPTFQALGQLI